MKEGTDRSRRQFIKEVGFVSIGFSLFQSCADDSVLNAARIAFDGKLPGSVSKTSNVNSWIQVLEDGKIRVLSGKVELGQGIRTAIRQVAAEELDYDIENVIVQLAETGLTPDEGYTAASSSVKNGVMSVRFAAAKAREAILQLASKELSQSIDSLVFQNGIILSSESNKEVTLSELLKGQQIEAEVTTPVQLKSKKEYRYVGKSIPRDDMEKIVLAKGGFIHNLRFPGMIHARVIRPPNYQSQLINFDDSLLRRNVTGILRTIVDGDFIAVVTEKEYQAVKARRFLMEKIEWTIPKIFPNQEELKDHIFGIASAPEKIKDEGDISSVFNTSDTLSASYFKPYIKHASMGPACGIAMYDGDILHVWSHSQGIYPMRRAMASMLNMREENIHIISVPGAGCFGHSTADDAAADAALIALSIPGKHVRVQWPRADEFANDPYGSAVITKLQASLSKEGNISAWKTDVWSDSHSTRPNDDGGTLLPARYLEKPRKMKSRGYLGGGHRNGDPYYVIPNLQLNAHYFNGPLRVSSLRGLGAYTNIFAIESFMDELALKAGTHPLDFRLNHLEDERAISIIEKIRKTTDSVKTNKSEGLGYAFMRYKNAEGYVAVAALVHVDNKEKRITLKKLWATVDVGEVINIDGIKNQIEGGLIQSASWALKEKVKFNASGITSTQWSDYPIFTFEDIPEIIVELIIRPEEPAMGIGEIILPPVAAAIGNAIFDASGIRLYDLPFRLNEN